MSILLQALLTFLLTIVAGGTIANRWQQKRSAEARLFDASNDTYRQMLEVSDRFVTMIGNRIYASQRVVLLRRDNEVWEGAIEDYKSAVKEWNKALISIELKVKILFRTVSLSELEPLQSDLRTVNLYIEKKVRGDNIPRAHEIDLHGRLAALRFAYFEIADRMISEARLLFREMHFGVRERYMDGRLANFSTWQLFKLLFKSRTYELSVIRSPADLGAPVSAWDTRFGVD